MTIIFAIIFNIFFYSSATTVTSVDYTRDIVTIETTEGQEFEFKGCEDWLEGDICSVVMFKNLTDEIYDDIIISTTYCGYEKE